MDFELRSSRRRTLPFVVGALAFVALGFYLVGVPSADVPIRYRGTAGVAGSLAILFFGLCLVASVWMFVRPVVLRADSRGLHVRWYLGGDYRWEDVASDVQVEVNAHTPNRIEELFFRAPAASGGLGARLYGPILRRYNGYDRCLPPARIFGCSAQEIADRCNAARAAYRASDPRGFAGHASEWASDAVDL